MKTMHRRQIEVVRYLRVAANSTPLTPQLGKRDSSPTGLAPQKKYDVMHRQMLFCIFFLSVASAQMLPFFTTVKVSSLA